MIREANRDRKRRRYEALRFALVLTMLLTAAAPAARACGYHDNVSVARGALNWTYPDSLHVVGAISRAVAERRLPPPNLDASRPDLFGSRYRSTARSLQRLTEALNAVPGNSSAAPFALVLVEPMLWTRFTADPAGLQSQIHAAGPGSRDLVLVSGEAVIGEIADGRLAIGEAHRLGLLRLYGTGSPLFLNTFKDVRGKRPEASHL